MARTFNWGKGVAEFAIVVVGVVVGLAADEWRQGFRERAMERGYLQRLEADLILGRERIAGHAARFSAASEAAGELIRLLEADNESTDPDRLVALAATAGQTGFHRSLMIYRTTYDELLATGYLGIIRDDKLRRAIVEHFRLADSLLEEADEIPQLYNKRFKSITGVRPVEYATGSVTMAPEVRARLLTLLRNDPEILAELRYFYAELAGAQQFQTSLDGIDDLLRQLRQEM